MAHLKLGAVGRDTLFGFKLGACFAASQRLPPTVLPDYGVRVDFDAVNLNTAPFIFPGFDDVRPFMPGSISIGSVGCAAGAMDLEWVWI